MAIIEIQLKSLPQLFDSLDPAPFRDKALDRDAEAYLVESLDELRPGESAQLRICGPSSLRESMPEITAAVHAHFRRAHEQIEWKLRRQMRVGRLSLLIGLLVLAVTLVVRYLLHEMGSTSAQILGEGMLIVGWVGLWRPAELLLFERLETRSERKVLERLSTIPVELRVLEE